MDLHFIITLLVLFGGAFGDDVLLFNFKGEVSSGEFLYYKITQPGDLLVILESLDGDADIYVSEKTHSPNYHPENYDLHSATCGTDKIFIPASMNRPIAVGIYGHSSSELSKFRLDVYQTSGSEHFYNSDFVLPQFEEPNDKKPVKTVTSRRRSRDKHFPNAMWRLLEVFEMFFL